MPPRPTPPRRPPPRQVGRPRRSSRARRRPDAPLPPRDGPGAVAPPLRWARRFTPFGIGRRGVRLELSGGCLTVVRVPLLRADRVVVSAPASEFHSLAVSRRGRGLHLWHGTRLFRFVGASSGDGDGSDVPSSSSSSADDPVSSFLALLSLPVHLVAAVAAHADEAAQERRHVATTLRWLQPVVGPPPPGVAVRPPLPGGWLDAARWTVRLAVLGALAAAVLALT